MNACRNCSCESIMWSDDRKYYYCPKCQKSFSIDTEKNEVKFSEDLVNAIAGQVATKLQGMFEKPVEKKPKPSAKKDPKDPEPDDKKEVHKWDQQE